MNKVGTTQWTMAKLLTLVLGVFLLVIIIYGVQNKGFGPLVENIEGRANEALIFIGWRDDGIPKCGDAFKESIDGVGMGWFYPCEDSCLFVLNGEESLLGFTNFSIKGDGITVSGDGVSDNDEVYRFGSAEAERHKEAYDLLNETVEEFLAKENMEYKDFVKAMSFDYGSTVYWEIHDTGDTTAYGYIDGVWRSGQVEKGGFVSQIAWWRLAKKDSNIMTDEEVFETVYKNFKRGKDVSIGYSSSAGNSEEDFREWFGYAKEKLNEDGEDDMVILEKKGRDEVSYTWDGESWKGEGYKRGIDRRIIVSREDLGFYDDRGVADVLYKHSLKGWDIELRDSIWDGRRWNIVDKGISYNIDVLYDEEDVIRKVFDEIKDEQEAAAPKHFKFISNVSAFLTDKGEVDFYGKPTSLKVGRRYLEDGHSFSAISLQLTSVDKFESSYRSREPILIYNNKFSVVAKFVDNSLLDWEDFIKINKIYEYFKLRRCGNE